MVDVTRLNASPSVGFRREAAVGDNDLGIYQKEHPTGSLHQIMLGWTGHECVCIAQDGGWLCVPTSPPESSASIANRSRSSAACVGAKIKERGRAWGSRYGVGWLVHQRGQMGFDSDSDRTPRVTTGSTANGSLERSGAMGLPDGKG